MSEFQQFMQQAPKKQVVDAPVKPSSAASSGPSSSSGSGSNNRNLYGESKPLGYTDLAEASRNHMINLPLINAIPQQSANLVKNFGEFNQMVNPLNVFSKSFDEDTAKIEPIRNPRRYHPAVDSDQVINEGMQHDHSFDDLVDWMPNVYHRG